MRFYKLTGIIENNIWEEEEDNRRKNETTCFFKSKSDQFYDMMKDKAFFFVSKVSEMDSSVEIGIIENGLFDMKDQLDQYLNLIGLVVPKREIEEITLRTLRRMLSTSCRRDFIEDDDEVIDRFDLSGLCGRRPFGQLFGENIIPDSLEKDIHELAKDYLIDESAEPELKLIYSVKKESRATGHPVHYLLITDDKNIRREGARLLLKALYSADRIRNRRYSFTDVDSDNEVSAEALEQLYKGNTGGALIIRFNDADSSDSEYASAATHNIEIITGLLVKYRNQVLTVLCLPQECTGLKKLLFENMINISFIEIKEDPASGERAKDYLRRLAKQNAICPDKNLFGMLEAGKGYYGPELSTMFDEWYDRKLKTNVYPQYKEVQAVKREVAKEKPKGSAYDELMQLIGLTEAKKVINNALNYYKAQKVFADKGMKPEETSMHMIFTGNPGSAKTTVARLLSQIMRENHLLSKGHLVEVGRGDLVGKYVGWTAKIVQQKFKEAEGGVLFIDEAYSLVDDRDGLYGDEAINTIVQEMENRRNSVVVIFAGYPDKMEGFLQKNPGLRSRIAFHVPFADYNADELIEIADLMSEKKGFRLSDDAKEKMHSIFETVCAEKDFGNGRYVRNMLDKARMAQATRLLEMDLDSVTKDDVLTITAADIEVPETVKPIKRSLGFSAA